MIIYQMFSQKLQLEAAYLHFQQSKFGLKSGENLPPRRA